MKRENIKLYLVLAIGIMLLVIAIKFFIAILPVIIILLFGYLIYDSYKKAKEKNQKDNKVREAEIIKEIKDELVNKK